jgi:uncharacterized protein
VTQLGVRELTIRRLFAEAGENAHVAALTLRDLVGDPERQELAGTLRDREHDGDRITHDATHALALGRRDGLVSIDAGDAYRLAGAIDDIVDYADEAGDALVLYRIEAPMEQAIKLADVLVLATAQVAQALTAFGESDSLELQLEEIHRLENEGDRLLRGGLASLFETGIDPMVVIRWKDIFERLEDAIDACQKVAHLLEGARVARLAQD